MIVLEVLSLFLLWLAFQWLAQKQRQVTALRSVVLELRIWATRETHTVHSTVKQAQSILGGLTGLLPWWMRAMVWFLKQWTPI